MVVIRTPYSRFVFEEVLYELTPLFVIGENYVHGIVLPDSRLIRVRHWNETLPAQLVGEAVEAIDGPVQRATRVEQADG